MLVIPDAPPIEDILSVATALVLIIFYAIFVLTLIKSKVCS